MAPVPEPLVATPSGKGAATPTRVPTPAPVRAPLPLVRRRGGRGGRAGIISAIGAWQQSIGNRAVANALAAPEVVPAPLPEAPLPQEPAPVSTKDVTEAKGPEPTVEPKGSAQGAKPGLSANPAGSIKVDQPLGVGPVPSPPAVVKAEAGGPAPTPVQEPSESPAAADSWSMSGLWASLTAGVRGFFGIGDGSRDRSRSDGAPGKEKETGKEKGPGKGKEPKAVQADAPGPGADVIETPPLLAGKAPGGPGGAGGLAATSPTGVAGKGGAKGELLPRGFPEKKKPAPSSKPKAKKGGGGGGAKPKGGGGKPARKPPLGDPALDKWRAAVGGAKEGVEPGDLGEAKNAAKEVTSKGDEVDSSRKAAQPDYTADAKSKQKPMPEEPPREKYLDTSGAEAAIKALEKAADVKLTTQTFSSLGAPPAYPGLNARDFVPQGLTKSLADMEAKLKTEKLSATEKADLSKKIAAMKEKIAGIEKTALDKAPDVAPSIKDNGPAKLTPPSPAQADVMGDVVVRALKSTGAKADDITKAALTAMHGDKIPPLVSLANDEKPALESEIKRELEAIAAAAGIDGKALAAKVEAEKQTTSQAADANQKDVHTATSAGSKQVEARAKEEGSKIKGGSGAVQKEIEEKQEAVKGPPDAAAIEKKRDEFILKAETGGAQAAAGLKAALAKRDSELDDGGRQQKEGIKSAADKQAQAIRRHWSEDTDKNKGMVEARPTAEWGNTRSGQVDREIRGFKAAASKEHAGFAAAVSTQIATSKEAIRDWAAHQEGTERSWWDRLWDMIKDWSSQAVSNNDAWEKQQAAESRDAMGKDLDLLTKMAELKQEQNFEALNKELGRLDKDQAELARKYLKGEGVDSIGFVAESTLLKIKSRRQPEVTKALEANAIAKLSWEELGQLARVTNPSFNPKELANKIKGGVAGMGTDEGKVYDGLGGARTAVERAALDKCYTQTHGTSMKEDIEGDMEDYELDRAKALMEGKGAEADAATIKEAVDGLGTDEDAIKKALRGKSPEEIDAIKAAYFEKYGVELKTDLADDTGGVFGGGNAEQDNMLALADGKTDEADAAELEDAMAGAGTDEAKIRTVYERIREEEEAKAQREGLTPAELKQRILDRNKKVKDAYDAKYGKASGVNLEGALQDELTDGGGARFANSAENQLVVGLMAGDMDKADAAKAYLEHEGTYASDDAIEGVVRNQRKKAEVEVALEVGAEKARMRALAEGGDFTPDEFKTEQARIKELDKNKEAEIVKRSKANMDKLESSYNTLAENDPTAPIYEKQGKYKHTFDQLIEQETSGYSKDEIKLLVTEGGKLKPEDEIYYAVAGAGTDEDKIKETLKGKTPAEIDAIRIAYESKPGRKPGDFNNDILGDLSGREDLDVGHTLQYGDPSTFGKQLDAAKTPAERKKILAGMEAMLDERKKFEETGLIGSIMSITGDPLNSYEQIEEAVKKSKDYDEALSKWEKQPENKDKNKEDDYGLYAAKANMEMNFGGALEAQEQVRSQIDAYADVAVQVGAAIAGIAVTVLTFGTAGPAVAALYGALAAAAATMAMKSTLKGAAYSWEEAGVDLATGAIDAAVSVATAGMGKVAVQVMEKAIAKLVAKQVAKEVAETGAKKTTAAMAKIWMKEAMEDVLENSVQGAVTGGAGVLLTDDAWKSGDPWGAAAKGAGMGAGIGAGVGVGIKGGKDIAGGAYGGIKGALKSDPKIDVGGGAPKLDAGDVAPPAKVDAEADLKAKGEAKAGDIPETKGIELPDEANPVKVMQDAADGKLPAGAESLDPSGGGKFAGAPGPEVPAGKAGIVEGPSGGLKAGGPDGPTVKPGGPEGPDGPKGAGDGGGGGPKKGADFIADDQGNMIDLNHLRSLKQVDVDPATIKKSRSGTMEMHGEPNSLVDVGNGHKRVYGPDGRLIMDVDSERIKIIEWHKNPETGEYFPKKGSDTKLAGGTPDEVADILGIPKKGKPGGGGPDGPDGPKGKGGGGDDGPAAKGGDEPATKVDEDAAPTTGDKATMGRPTVDDVGKPLTDEDLAGRYGMPKKNVDKIKAICSSEGIIVDIRPTTPHAEPMLREGKALPKPEKLKAKTINEVDVQLGLAKEADLGKVGFYDPYKAKLPDNFDALEPDVQKKLLDRMKQRAEEFASYQKDMAKLLDEGKIRIEPDGTIINTGLIKGGGELPFTGDHDIFDIRAADGTALPPDRYKAVKKKLMEADAGIMHGGVTGWDIDSPGTFHTTEGQDAFWKMMKEHSAGGKEPLVRFGDGEPSAVWFEPAKAANDAMPATGKVGGDAPTGKVGGDDAFADTMELPVDARPKAPEALPGEKPAFAGIKEMVPRGSLDKTPFPAGEVDPTPSQFKSVADANDVIIDPVRGQVFDRQTGLPVSDGLRSKIQWEMMGQGPNPNIPANPPRFDPDVAVKAGDVSGGPKATGGPDAKGGPGGDVPAAVKGMPEPKAVSADLEAKAKTLESALPANMQGKVPVSIDPDLPANTVRVHYDTDPDTGLITKIHVRAGAGATLADIALHAGTIKSMQKYQGLMGEVRLLLQEIKGLLGFKAIVPGTKAWEAKLEIEKLPGVIKDRLDRLAKGVDADERALLDADVANLRKQLEVHGETARMGDLAGGSGFVAADGAVAKIPTPGAKGGPVAKAGTHSVDAPKTVGGGRKQYTVSGVVGDSTGRQHYERKLAASKEVLFNGKPLKDFHRAHAWGPGFGSEAMEGIMLAPAHVNLDIQNEGIEGLIRHIHKNVAPGGGRVEVEVEVTSHPHNPGYTDKYGMPVEFLSKAEYTVKVTKPDGSVVEFTGGFSVGKPPAGEVRFHGLEQNRGNADWLQEMREDFEDALVARKKKMMADKAAKKAAAAAAK